MNPQQKDILISVVIPVYNNSQWIGATIQSVIDQQYRNLEIIVVDDGSKDNTWQVIQDLSAMYPMIKGFQIENGGQGRARNFGVKQAKGDWIAFIDSDDLWLPGKLERQLHQSLLSGIDMSFTNGYICLNNDLELTRYPFGVPDRIYQGEDDVQHFHIQNRVPTSSVMIKRKVFIAAGGFPESRAIQNAEDYYLWTKLLTLGHSLMGMSEILLKYRVHEGSSTAEEVKALLPLIEVLLQLPGKHGEARARQLNIVTMRIVNLLSLQKELRKIQSQMPHILPIIRVPAISWLLKLLFMVNKRLFVSILHRTEKSWGLPFMSTAKN
jgi:teichuronic acid biosynthesis glycosyltransferase TuaG